MNFTHPLARAASVWSTGGAKGRPHKLLVVITTLELDPAHKKYKADQVDRLAGAAKDWLGENASLAEDFMLINRARDW
jgi:hypothetical protein